jgi:hypothetical protein
MARKLLFQAASVIAALVASAFIVDYDPLASASVSSVMPFSVNRTLKGDLLPMTIGSRPSPHTADNQRETPVAKEAPTSKRAPDGCDPSFSPIAAPRLADVFGRCTT